MEDRDNPVMSRRREHYRQARRDLRLGSIWTNFAIENLHDDHDFPLARHLVYEENWGNPVKVPIMGRTWLSLWQAADQAIKQSGDSHHIYIERFKEHPNEPRTLILVTGS